MPHEDLGAGIHLTEELDIDVDETGDIAFEQGIEELGKDLGFYVIREVEPEWVGETILEPDLRQIALSIEQTIEEDDRVDSVDVINAFLDDSSQNTVIVEAELTALEERVETVIPLSL